MVVVLAIVSSIQTGSGGSARDFRLVVYQGQDILGGDELNLSSLFDQGKPVVLNFWAGLCPPCRAEMPSFQRVYDDRGGEFILVGVDIGPFVGLGSHDDALQFLKDFDIRYPTGYAVNADPVRDYNVRSMPTTLFLTPDGKIFDRWSGLLTEDRLHSKLQDLLDASSS